MVVPGKLPVLLWAAIVLAEHTSCHLPAGCRPSASPPSMGLSRVLNLGLLQAEQVPSRPIDNYLILQSEVMKNYMSHRPNQPIRASASGSFWVPPDEGNLKNHKSSIIVDPKFSHSFGVTFTGCLCNKKPGMARVCVCTHAHMQADAFLGTQSKFIQYLQKLHFLLQFLTMLQYRGHGSWKVLRYNICLCWPPLLLPFL